MKTDIRMTETLALWPITVAVKRASMLVLAAGFLCAWCAAAADARPKLIKESLSSVPAAEMPAKAAEIVKNTKVRDRASTTAEVTLAAGAINPAAVSTVVAAISKTVPEMAAIAAAAAAEAQPKLAAELARAAAAVAPARAGKIVAAICRAVPNQYKAVAYAVAEAVPGAAKEILLAVASSVPSMKPGIDAALANQGFKALSVRAVLEAVTPVSAPANGTPAVAATGPALGHGGAGATLAPAMIPPSPNTPDPGPGPRGHRNYAAP